MKSLLKFQWNYFRKSPAFIGFIFIPVIGYVVFGAILSSGTSIAIALGFGVFIATYYASSTYFYLFEETNTITSISRTNETKKIIRKTYIGSGYTNFTIFLSIYIFSFLYTLISILLLVGTAIFFVKLIPSYSPVITLTSNVSLGVIAEFGTWQRWFSFLYGLIMTVTLTYSISYCIYRLTNSKTTNWIISLIYLIILFPLGGLMVPRYTSNGQFTSILIPWNTGAYGILQYFVPSWYANQYLYWIFGATNQQFASASTYLVNPSLTTTLSGGYSVNGIMFMVIPWLWSMLLLSIGYLKEYMNIDWRSRKVSKKV